MKVLLTGAAGTLGVPLFDGLEQAGYEVVGCDLKHTSHPRIFRCDVAEFRQLAELLRREKPDVVYNLAAEIGRRNGTEYYEHMWRTNVIGMEHLLKLQRELGFKLIHFSSSEVYGEGPFSGLENDQTRALSGLARACVDHHSTFIDEDGMNLFPRVQHNSYAISKWANECQIINARRHHGQRIVRVRPCCVYGPGEYYTPYRSVCCQFAYRLLHMLPIDIFVAHSRCFLYIDDLIPTLCAIATKFVDGAVYNIGSSEVTPIGDLAILVAELLKLTQEERTRLLVEIPVETHNTLNKQPTIQRATTDLGHSPKWDIKAGMTSTIAWMRRVYAKSALAAR